MHMLHVFPEPSPPPRRLNREVCLADVNRSRPAYERRSPYDTRTG